MMSHMLTPMNSAAHRASLPQNPAWHPPLLAQSSFGRGGLAQ